MTAVQAMISEQSEIVNLAGSSNQNRHNSLIDKAEIKSHNNPRQGWAICHFLRLGIIQNLDLSMI